MLGNCKRIFLANGSSKILGQISCLSTSTANNKSYDLVVVGGGAGGCSTGAKFARKLGKGSVAIIEPSDTHYYQPLWTLVGGGIKNLEDSSKPMSKVLPKNADWIQQKVASFKPDQNKVVTESGEEINYNFLVVAMGIQLNYEKIKGLPEAFETPGVCSNYSPLYVGKTLESLKNFKSGNALFTQPATPIKCAGAPQKIMFLSEEFLTKNGKRENSNVMFTNALASAFGVPIYAFTLMKLYEERDIDCRWRHNLIEIRPDSKEAVFEISNMDQTDIVIPYEMIHITPPMSAPDVLRNSSLGDSTTGFLDINKYTLQHTKYKNIFGIGDCTNLPTSRTAAAVAGQLGVLSRNLSSVMKGLNLEAAYDGYTSCPIVTSSSKCVMAEFGYDQAFLETTPLDQSRERYSMYFLKKNILPLIYWQGLIKGFWTGPKLIRKIIRLDFEDINREIVKELKAGRPV